MKLLLKTAFLVSAAIFSFSVNAVDGFQNLKFGMTLDEVKAAKKCDWIKHKKIPYSYECKNYSFLDTKTRVLTSYSKGKLAQVQVMIPEERLKKVIDGLPKKYEVSTPYKEEKVNGDRQMTVKFDDDTLELKVTYKGNDDYNYTALLIYSDKVYLNNLKKEQDQQIKDEL